MTTQAPIYALESEIFDVTVATDYLIQNVGSSSFTLLHLNVELMAVSEDVSIVPTISAGITEPNYNDLIFFTGLTEMTTQNMTVQLKSNDLCCSIPANTPVYLKVLNPAVATEYKIKVTMLGIYRQSDI